MNYIIHFKFFFLFSLFCIVSAVIYVLVNLLGCVDDHLLYEEPYCDDFPRTLNMLNFQKIVCWKEPPSSMKNDIFMPVKILKSEKGKREVQICEKLVQPQADMPCPVCFDGWSGINENMVFVFSALNSNKTFIGSVGDSFDNPDFTIMSVDLKTIKDDWHLYSVPIVTILDKKGDRLITLAPVSSNQNLNAIN